MEATGPRERKVELLAVRICGKNFVLCHCDIEKSCARTEISQHKTDELT
jgi:hypothetical protein